MKQIPLRLSVNVVASYRIVVQGRVESEVSESIFGLSAVSVPNAEATLLCGAIADQSALIGVLNWLHDLRLPILSVEWSPHDGETDEAEIQEQET